MVLNKKFSTPSEFTSFIHIDYSFDSTHNIFLDISIPLYNDPQNKLWQVAHYNIKKQIEDTGTTTPDFDYFIKDFQKKRFQTLLGNSYENNCINCKNTFDILNENNSHFFDHDFNCRFIIKDLSTKN